MDTKFSIQLKFEFKDKVLRVIRSGGRDKGLLDNLVAFSREAWRDSRMCRAGRAYRREK